MARGVARTASDVDLGPVGHYMLRRVRDWNAVALSSCRDLLLRVDHRA